MFGITVMFGTSSNNFKKYICTYSFTLIVLTIVRTIFETKYHRNNLFVFLDPAGDTRNRIKTSSLEIGFLGIKILLVCYESQLNKEWFRIARTIKDMGNRSGPQVFFKTVPYFCRPTQKKWKN